MGNFLTNVVVVIIVIIVVVVIITIVVIIIIIGYAKRITIRTFARGRQISLR